MKLKQIQKQVEPLHKNQLVKIKGGSKDSSDAADNNIIIVDEDML